jgi:leucyl/phenylalanyl-tRNA---protein transferase
VARAGGCVRARSGAGVASGRMRAEVIEAVERYASGAFPMDDAESQGGPLPWYTAPERAVFSLDEGFRDRMRAKLRRDLRRCEHHELVVDADYDAVLTLCANPPEGEGIWITPRLKELYRALHTAGFAHSFELRAPDGALSAGILGVVIGRAAMLESMRRTQPSAGNALLSRTLDLLAERGATLCDIQLPTDHTLRLGCELIPHSRYVRALHAAIAPTSVLADPAHGR